MSKKESPKKEEGAQNNPRLTLEELFEAMRELPVKTTEDLRLERFFYRVECGIKRAKIALELIEKGNINPNELRYNRSYALMYEHAKSKGGIKWQ